MPCTVNRSLMTLLLLLVIALVPGCGEDTGVAPVEKQDFWRQTNGPSNEIVTSFAINSSGDIFAGTWSGGVFRSEDDGDRWISASDGLTNNVSALAINPSGHIFAGTNGGVFRSVDNGDSWTAVNNGLTNDDIRAFALDSEGHLYAGVYGGGIYCSVESTD